MGTNIEAPMPGKIIGVKVQEGASVQEGDVLIVLEAMKMENAIESPVSGVIEKVNKKEGDSVDDGDVLIVIG
jgi:biotin carboxyl carrier protein